MVAGSVIYRNPVRSVMKPPLDEDEAHILALGDADFSRAVEPVAVPPSGGAIVHQAHLCLYWLRITAANVHWVPQVRTQPTQAREQVR